MKTKFKLLLLLAGLLSVTSAIADNIKYANDRSRLSSKQIEVLDYALKLVQGKDFQIIFPNEVYSIIGDTANHDTPMAMVLWDKAYFMKDADWKHTLVIPLKAKTTLGTFTSNIYVHTNDCARFIRVVKTSLPTKEYLARNSYIDPNNPKYSGYVITSNINGIFLRAFYYDNGTQVYQVEGIMGNIGVSDPPSPTRRKHDRMNF